ncbi:MAG: trigger factor [Chloroflexota bacterium]|nr:trigger factor [Chloroflexota bacterium]
MIERLPESRVQLEITAEEAETSAAMDRAARKVGNQVTLPGFRKGKAPRAMIERVYGPDVFTEEANRYLLSDLYRQAIEQEDLTPLGDPEVEISSTDPLTYTVVVAVYPTIDPGDYSSVRIDPIDAAVDDTAVDEMIETLRKAHSPWVDPESEGLSVGAGLELTPKTRTPKEGDQITIDYSVQEEDGEDAEEPVTDAVFVLGESGLLGAVEDAIQGLRVGESTGFSVNFAEDDESVDQSVRGKTLAYNVTLKGLKERDLLPLDDEFAKTVGEAETLGELRASLQEELHQRRTAEARGQALSQIISKIAEGAALDLPAPMVDDAVENDVRRMRMNLAQQGVSLEAYLRSMEASEAELREEMRPAALERLRNSLLMRAIAEKEAIAVDDAELDTAIARMAAAAQTSAQPEQAAQFAASDYVRTMLQNEMFDRQLTDRLIELATEGRGAVINGWVAPEPVASDEMTPAGEAAEMTSEAESEPATDEEVVEAQG